MILVSACLAGLKVRYNATHKQDEKIRCLVEEGKAVTVCPELLGGLATPRLPAEIMGGTGADVLNGIARVIDRAGHDVTELYIKGAYETLQKARELNATLVVLKESSPSCGSSLIHNGEFSGEKVAGDGVTAALLKRNGIPVITEDQL